MIQNGFRACGLYPWDVDAVDFNVLVKRKKKKSKADDSSKNSPSPQEQNNSTDVTPSQVLQLFEDTLDSSLFQQFKDSQSIGEWTGDMTQQGLFDHWMKIKKCCVDKNSQDHLRVSESTQCSSNTSTVSTVSYDVSPRTESMSKTVSPISTFTQPNVPPLVPVQTLDLDNLGPSCLKEPDPLVVMNTNDNGLITFELLDGDDSGIGVEDGAN
ncbi:hypothetical protein QAD02_020625 [Eretmocerus hayati]|uniref:Uncharacterized protein n=1 Tax=Eretmocerus hayati TaxID=131215 RepID=A0ACC2PN43_9HYME|nr:hypothetical protein QAD02_020625 [Eretmocerus hayati]